MCIIGVLKLSGLLFTVVNRAQNTSHELLIVLTDNKSSSGTTECHARPEELNGLPGRITWLRVLSVADPNIIMHNYQGLSFP